LQEIDLNKGLTVEQLDRLIGQRDYRAFLNTRNELYRERGMKQNPPPRDEALELMAAHPNLIKRPILVKGGEIVLGFQEEEMRGLL
jgi:arsenate reductase-like glutaredoxin family protein